MRHTRLSTGSYQACRGASVRTPVEVTWVIAEFLPIYMVSSEDMDQVYRLYLGLQHSPL